MASQILYSVDEGAGIARVTLDRPERRNALNRALVEELKELESNWELSRDPNFLRVSQQVQSDLNDLITSVTSRFEAFRQKTDYMWHEISADKYRDVKELVGDAQRTVSGVLCGLGVKLNAWNERFPKKDVGGPVARNEMLFADILPGLDKLVKMEQ